MHQLSKQAIVLALVCGLSACASIVGGTHQQLTVKTRSAGQDIVGANCTVSNQRGSQNVTTPGTVTVHRDSGPLDVHCAKDGAPVGEQEFDSSVRGMVWGNLVFGGLVGIIVDFSNGAARHYPNVLTIMSAGTQSSVAAYGLYATPNGSAVNPLGMTRPSSDLASLDPRISKDMFDAAQNVAAAQQCDRAIHVVMADGQRALFKSTCAASRTLQIECTDAACVPLHSAG